MNDDPSVAEEVRHLSMLVEEVMSQNKAVLEIAADNQEKIALLPKMQEDIAELKADVATIKLAVTDTNKELKLHDRRITKLENLSRSH